MRSTEDTRATDLVEEPETGDVNVENGAAYDLEEETTNVDASNEFDPSTHASWELGEYTKE